MYTMREEYPRPNFQRDEWQSLNGEWEFYYGETQTTIQVPFVPQCKLSGIHQRIKEDYVTYKRTFTVNSLWKDKEIFLNFGAVDYECTVYINGKMAGSHTGGSTPFSLNITKLLLWQQEQIVVEVYDPLYDDKISRGKQFWKDTSEFIWYTPSTGIWQTVWLEPMDKTHLDSIRFTPDLDKGMVEIDFTLARETALPCHAKIEVSFENKPVARLVYECTTLDNKMIVDIFKNQSLEGGFHFTGHYWAPHTPHLFDVTVDLLLANECKDHVQSYFGMRKIHTENGQFYLNNVPYYNKLLLDQGYWKDGLITAPTDQDYIDDIEKMKKMGFNGCRKHEKVEDPRFLYWADKLGFLVWEEMPSFWSYSPKSAAEYSKEWATVIARDYNHPCIVVWNMNNESWGVPRLFDDTAQQAFINSLYYLAHALDKTRLVIGNDGWETVLTDIGAFHSYKHGAEDDIKTQQLFEESLNDISLFHNIVERVPYAKGYQYHGEPIMLTEFGGISQGKDDNSWGYTVSKSDEEFLKTFKRAVSAVYASTLICGFCYTQLADIEQETNGLLDVDHNFKFDPEKIKQIVEQKKINNM